MTYEVKPHGQRAYCDRCLLTTPRMHAANVEAASEILHAAGWRTLEAGRYTYCPRCGASFARERARASATAASLAAL